LSLDYFDLIFSDREVELALHQDVEVLANYAEVGKFS